MSAPARSRALCVSVAAVSQALNGKGRISKATADVIRQTAREMGFVPNQGAARMRSGESLLLGLVVTDISNPFYAELTSEVEDTAYAEGYLSIIANCHDDPERQEALLQSMIGQGVAGLMIVPAAGSMPQNFDLIHAHGIPFVFCVRGITDERADFVGFDDFKAAYAATRHLIELGHTRFGVIGGLTQTKTGWLRIDGVRIALRDAGLALDEAAVLPGPPTSEFGAEATGRLLARNGDITALMCHNDYVAFGAYAALAGKRQIGTDISVVGFDNVAGSDVLAPPLTTIGLDSPAIGKRAVEVLLARIRAGETVRQSINLAARLIVRGSTGPAPSAGERIATVTGLGRDDQQRIGRKRLSDA